jgi:hypothetical protein
MPLSRQANDTRNCILFEGAWEHEEYTRCSELFDDRESDGRQYNGTELLHADKHEDNITTIINNKTKHNTQKQQQNIQEIW